jgi:hypothetical protein
METALAQASMSSQKSEREYVTLKDSIKGMVEGWQREVKMLREDVKKKEDEWGKEREEVALKYKSLLKLQQATKLVFSCCSPHLTMLTVPQSRKATIRWT